jgi:phosphoglycolate phosphatase-like HAD superfamily hydrolase
MRLIVLFDLDGTVLTFAGGNPGPGRVSMRRAMRDLVGAEDATEGVRFAGRTDRAIVRTMLERVGFEGDTERAIAEGLARYLEHLTEETTRRPYLPIGDVVGTVEALHTRGASVGIGTGNVREGAAIKLASAGLLASFDLERGGYGCDAEDRGELLRIAALRCAAASGRPPEASVASEPARVVVVGDTRLDVEAARAIGAHVVGVAASAAARDELEAAGAEAIVGACGSPLVEAIFAVAARPA